MSCACVPIFRKQLSGIDLKGPPQAARSEEVFNQTFNGQAIFGGRSDTVETVDVMSARSVAAKDDGRPMTANQSSEGERQRCLDRRASLIDEHAC